MTVSVTNKGETTDYPKEIISPASEVTENDPTTIAPILRLPPEIFSHFLDHVPPQLLQRTALALHKVFPDARVTEEYLWRYVTVRKGEQLVPLWHAARRRRERVEKDGMRARVEGFIMEAWRGDADILNNALRCLPDIPNLLINMGTNFAPEHLAEMFDTHRPTMQRLELRFKPYVEQASYYQFLKGSYFDTAIEMLTHKWPESPSFTRLAIVQDLPPRTKHIALPVPTQSSSSATAVSSTAVSTVPSTAASTVPSSHTSPSILPSTLSTEVAALDLGSDEEEPISESTDSPVVEPRGYSGHGPFGYLGDKLAWARPKTFAQPIVFFDIKCIARFGASPSARHLTHIRLRVPSRDVVSVLIAPPGKTYFPSLRNLDISTTNVRLDTVLSTLLKQYEHLEHLIMDRVNLFGFQAKDKGAELCRTLGGMVPSAGLARGKERERAIAAWDVAERTRAAVAYAEALRRANQGSGGGGPSPGGGGETPLEQAARQAREAAAERERQLDLARTRRGHRSAAMSTFSLRTSSRRTSISAGSSTAAAAGITLGPTDRLYLVLPPLPTMRTLSVGGEARLTPLQIREWSAEFHAGWRESLGKIAGWAGHVGERYERARRKADEWAISQLRSTDTSTGGKGKGKATPKVALPKPPTDVRLYRYPLPSEPSTVYDPSDPTAGLILIDPEDNTYLGIYKDRLADADMYAADNSYPPPCVLCTVPDCEGPPRRGDEGGKVDGRGGMDGKHAEGCGHLVGRGVWGWEGM